MKPNAHAQAPRPPGVVEIARIAVAAACALGFALAGGCTLAPTPPTIYGTSPDWAYNGEPTEITIEGAHFFPTVIVDGDGEEGVRTGGAFQAWLVDGDVEVPLERVLPLSYTSLTGEVPEGLDTGVYDVRVELPSGLVTTAENIFTVTDTRADHLDLSVVGAVGYEVGEETAVSIWLLDPEGAVVTQALDVWIRASSPLDAAGVVFSGTGLVDQQPAAEGVGVTGSLAIDGTGFVILTSDAADNVTLEVVARDEGSTVRSGSIRLSWDPGDVANVDLALPRQEGFKTRAGDPFTLTITLEDAFGNVLTDEVPPDLTLLGDCAGVPTGWSQQVSVVDGQSAFEVQLDTACTEQRIYTNAYDLRWESPTFTVLPAQHQGYDVLPLDLSVTAGEPVFFYVEAVDAYGNVVTDHSGAVTLRDNLGGLDPDTGRGEQECPGFEADGYQICWATLWTAGPEVVVHAEDGEARTGVARAIEVVPAAADTVLLLIDSGEVEVEAGELFDVSVRVLDVYDNSVGFDPAGTDWVEFSDDSDSVECEWRGADAGAQTFECTITGAVADANLRAEVLGLPGYAADPLSVINAALAEVDVDPQGGGFVAGTAFTLELRGFDDYGNAYLVQTDTTVDLSDSGGAMSPATAVLGADGTVQVSTVVYGAGTAVRLYAAQGGVRLGSSRPLLISPNVQNSIAIDAPAWISVDDPASVELTAVDAYDNAITTYTGSVTLSSTDGNCDPVVVDDFVAGVASVDLTCDTPGLSDVLVATDDGGYDGESDVVDVVDLGCVNGPTAALTLDGDVETIRCLADGGTVEVDLSTAGSSAGGSAIAVRHYDDAESLTTRTTSTVATLTYDTAGTRYVEALVADTRACADLTGGYVYIGSDDGEPTGPVSVSTSASTVSSSTVGSVTVQVSATDCTSDLAAGQTLRVRADLGTPGATSTGKGLEVTLDARGEASLTWSFDTGYHGAATFYAGSVGGGAVGSAGVTIEEDSVLPTVVEVIPSGVELGTIPHVQIVFSEPMLPGSVTSSNITVTGPSGAVTGTLTQSDDLETVVFVPTTPIDGSAGTYTLGITQYLRDSDRNQLDGGWSGVRAAASFTFGDVSETVPEISSCSLASAVFVPDGDDGSGGEADAAAVTPTATAAPAWWWLSAYDADGTRVRSARVLGTETTVPWDGRGDDGIVQDAGQYRLSTAPIDTYGNVGGRCDVAVELEQHLDLP